ncbi:hypothetical protein Sjap_005685 [Stephania japonica]|uniref:Uncharacterized protein n=1 Tax=Stephania japonica TaxID=461633 RepID=A0AAP0K4L5_9MAGN
MSCLLPSPSLPKPSSPLTLHQCHYWSSHPLSSRVEGNFPNGAKLITVHSAIASDEGKSELVLLGFVLPVPSQDNFPKREEHIVPSKIIYEKEDIVLNSRMRTVTIYVVNSGDQPIQEIKQIKLEIGSCLWQTDGEIDFSN